LLCGSHVFKEAPALFRGSHHFLMIQPLHDIFGNRDSFGHIGKKVTELLEYVINFMADWTEPQSQVDIMQ
jgi:hypothetical protein